MFKYSPLILVLILLIGSRTHSQQQYKPKDPSLEKTILKQDSLLFDAFNRQDINTLGSLFSPELEFYNDGGGMTGFKKTINNFKAMFERNRTSSLRRELVKKSFEVYPISGYGAIALGNHRFLHTENGKQEIGEQKFVITWKLNKNHWQVTRIVSLGH